MINITAYVFSRKLADLHRNRPMSNRTRSQRWSYAIYTAHNVRCKFGQSLSRRQNDKSCVLIDWVIEHCRQNHAGDEAVKCEPALYLAHYYGTIQGESKTEPMHTLFTDFFNSIHSKEIAIKWSLKILPHLKRVPTLPFITSHI